MRTQSGTRVVIRPAFSREEEGWEEVHRCNSSVAGSSLLGANDDTKLALPEDAFLRPKFCGKKCAASRPTIGSSIHIDRALGPLLNGRLRHRWSAPTNSTIDPTPSFHFMNTCHSKETTAITPEKLTIARHVRKPGAAHEKMAATFPSHDESL